MSSGTGADKTTSEDIPSTEVKAAGAANLILLQGGRRSNHLPHGYQWCQQDLIHCPNTTALSF